MGCGCGSGGVQRIRYEVETTNSGGSRKTPYSSASEARAAAASSGGTAYRIEPNGNRTRL